jgi:glycosyltransferase involved in cell wall biosynthesis
MRILLVANYLPDALQSMQRFAALLHRGLDAAGHDVRVVRPSTMAGKLYGIPGGKWFGYVDKFVLFPPALKRLIAWADIVHVCDHSNSLYVKFLKDKPHVVTCHDMLAIRSARGEIAHHPTRWTGRCLQSMILHGLAKAQHIVCVSDATKDDLQRIASIDKQKLSRIYNGLNYPYSPMARNEGEARLFKLGVVPGRFILHVGGNQWYKNRLGVLSIFSILQKIPAAQHLKLIMVGKPWTENMRAFARREELTPIVLELTGVSEEDLRALYSCAELMLFPSLAEGFGWPIAEAQACGCPVITSGRAPMTEVGGEAAQYLDPENLDSAPKVILDVLQNKEDLAARGLRNASRFITDKMVDAYAATYRGLAKHA